MIDELLLADGFGAAFIGVSHRFGFDHPVATYDIDKCIEILIQDGMDREEAEEYFEFNTLGAWVGEMTPVFVEVMPLKELRDEWKEA